MQEDPMPVIALEWENTAHFRVDWIEKINEHQKKILPAEKIKNQMNLRTWFAYYFNPNKPETSTYGCRLCRDYYDKFKLAANYKSSLANPEGTLKTSLKANSNAINDHPKSAAHLNVISKLKELQKDSLPDVMASVQSLEEEKDNQLYQITAMMMKTVYAEVRMNVPFMYHPYLVELITLHGAKTGTHHHDKNGAIRMMNLMSSEMHQTLLKTLKEKNYPCSLIVDTSTSIGLYHYLTVLIQTLENERPVVYFYRLIEAGADSTAGGLLTVLKNALEQEAIDIMPYIMENLVGFGSDGASVNLGKKGGFVVKLENFINRKLYTVWCMPHRLELAIKAAIRENPGMKRFDGIVTELTNFYNSKSYKRKAHLRSTAIKENVNLYELHYAFKERWIMSDFTAVRAVLKGWKVFISDLKSIQKDIHFKNDWARAKGIEKRLKSRTFVLGLHFLFDVLHSLKKFSVLSQQSAGLLIGKELFRKDLLNLPFQFEEHDGPNVIKLLQETFCDTIHTCTAEEFLSNEVVIFNMVELEKDRNPLTFIELRKKFLKSLANEIESYFPEGTYSAFDKFIPKNLPLTVSEAFFYGQNEVQELARKFNLDPETVSKEWINLLISMLDEDGFCDKLQKTAESFWPAYLKRTDLNWGISIARLIRTILVLPASSADAERSFSIMNHIKYDRRASLTSINLDHLMRLRINGPNKLDRFASAKYARAWVKAGHWRTDDSSRGQKRKREEVGDNDEEDEETGKIFMTSDLF